MRNAWLNIIHGGVGAMLIAMRSMVPYFVDPCNGDQPMNAKITKGLQVGCDLSDTNIQ